MLEKMKKKTMGVLLTILLLSVYGISVNAKEGSNPFDEIWDYIISVIVTPDTIQRDPAKEAEPVMAVKVETVEQYPQRLTFDFCNGNIMKLKGFDKGMQAVFRFNVRGRVWENKEGKEMNFMSLRAYSLS